MYLQYYYCFALYLCFILIWMSIGVSVFQNQFFFLTSGVIVHPLCPINVPIQHPFKLFRWKGLAYFWAFSWQYCSAWEALTVMEFSQVRYSRYNSALWSIFYSRQLKPKNSKVEERSQQPVFWFFNQVEKPLLKRLAPGFAWRSQKVQRRKRRKMKGKFSSQRSDDNYWPNRERGNTLRVSFSFLFFGLFLFFWLWRPEPAFRVMEGINNGVALFFILPILALSLPRSWGKGLEPFFFFFSFFVDFALHNSVQLLKSTTKLPAHNWSRQGIFANGDLIFQKINLNLPMSKCAAHKNNRLVCRKWGHIFIDIY